MTFDIPIEVDPRPCGVCGGKRDGWHCPTCHDRAERRDRRQKLHLATREFVSSLPDWMTWARLGSPEFAEKCSLPELRKFAATYHPRDSSVVASALTGVGKTTGLVALAHRALDEAKQLGDLDHWIVRAVWTTGHDLASARREHRLGAGEAPLIAAAKRASVLFLDELGFEPPSEAPFEVVDVRDRARLPTLVTTGLRIDPDPSGQSLRQKYGDALVRRLLERGSRIEGWKRG